MVFSFKCLRGHGSNESIIKSRSSRNGNGRGIKETMMFWRKNKCVENETKEALILHLPDDVLEKCLVRLPLETLMDVRLVCKKLNSFTTSSNFLEMRKKEFKCSWLFLFGSLRFGSNNAGITELMHLIYLTTKDSIPTHPLDKEFLEKLNLPNDITIPNKMILFMLHKIAEWSTSNI